MQPTIDEILRGEAATLASQPAGLSLLLEQLLLAVSPAEETFVRALYYHIFCKRGYELSMKRTGFEKFNGYSVVASGSDLDMATFALVREQGMASMIALKRKLSKAVPFSKLAAMFGFRRIT